MWVGSLLYFCSIGTNQVRDIASFKEEIKSKLMLPFSDSPRWMTWLHSLFSLIAFCTLISTEVVFYFVFLYPRAGRNLSSFFTTPVFPLRKGNPLQKEKETLCMLRMGGGWKRKRDWERGGGRCEIGMGDGEERMREGKTEQEDGGCPKPTPGSKSRALCKVLFQEMHMWSHYISHNRPPGAPSPSLSLPPPKPKCTENTILQTDSSK